jgi:hypothetical protein
VKVIDANTGRELFAPMRFVNVMGIVDVDKIVPGLFRASARIRIDGGPWRWVPLQVRWTHPGFFLQHVAFLPS